MKLHWNERTAMRLREVNNIRSAIGSWEGCRNDAGCGLSVSSPPVRGSCGAGTGSEYLFKNTWL